MGQIVSDVTEILDYKKDKKEASSERKKILAEMAADESTKTNLVKKALATQRAKYGAAGISNRSSSAGAVLSRVASEAAEPYNEKRRKNIEKLKQVRTKKTNLVKSILSRLDDLVA